MGEGALFANVVTADTRRSHSAVTLTPCQLLMLPRSNFAKFEECGRVLLKDLRRSDARNRMRAGTPWKSEARDGAGTLD